MAKTTVWGGINEVPRPTGEELFSQLTAEDQNKAIGPEAAALVREGAPLKDFVSHSPQSEQPDFITQKPAQDVAT